MSMNIKTRILGVVILFLLMLFGVWWSAPLFGLLLLIYGAGLEIIFSALFMDLLFSVQTHIFVPVWSMLALALSMVFVKLRKMLF